MSKAIRRVVSIAAPIVGGFLGGPVGAAIGGAIGGAASGGGVRAALMGGITGYMGAGAAAPAGLSSASTSLASSGGILSMPAASNGLGAAISGGVRSLAAPMGVGGISQGQLLNAASGIVGGMNKDAAEEAAKKQAQGIQAGMNANTAAMQPYTAMGADATRRIGEIQADPAAYIQNNPLYNSLAADAERRLMANEAAKGKVGSGGTAAALQEKMLNLGTGLVNTEIGNLQTQAGMGGNAASQVGQTSYAGNVGVGDVNAAGTIGANNALTSQYQNQINTILAMQGMNKAPVAAQPINL